MLPRNNDKSLILTCGINKANRPWFDYPDSPWTDGHLSGSAIYQPGSPFLSISPALKKRRHWLRLMSNTWPGQAFPLLPGEVFGLIKRTVFAAKDLGCETERFWQHGRISSVALGIRMWLPLWLADRVSTLGILQKHPNGKEMAYSSNYLLSWGVFFTSVLYLSLSLSHSFFFSFIHSALLPICRLPGVTFNLEVLWLGRGSLHGPPNCLHPSVTVRPLLVLLSSKSQSELLRMQKLRRSDLTVTWARMTAKRVETLPMTSL